MKFWEYDYKKTKQDFSNDIKGVYNEMRALSRMKEGSNAWEDKLRAVDSAINRMIAKCSDNTYPHVLLRLNYCTSMIAIHLSVLAILKKTDPENYVEYSKDKC